MKQAILICMGMLIFTAPVLAQNAGDAERRESVEQRHKELAPYTAEQAKESFSKTVHGGVMHVVNESGNAEQVRLIQDHLKQMAEEFRKGDFSNTLRMHGADMPGLKQLQAAQPNDIQYEYKALSNGAQIHFATEYPQYVQALHEWLDAQAKDHGNAVVPEHSKHHSGMSE